MKFADGQKPVVLIPVVGKVVEVQVALGTVPVQDRDVGIAVRILPARAVIYTPHSVPLPFEPVRK